MKSNRFAEWFFNAASRSQRMDDVSVVRKSRFAAAKAYRNFRLTAINFFKDSLLILAGVFAAAFGLKSFLIPNHFIDGGATGISLLIAAVSGWSLSLLLLLVNIPFIILGIKAFGRGFVVRTVIAIGCLAAILAVIHFPDVTHDKLLVSVFGGFFLGAGIGLSVRGGAVLDGTEVLAIYLSRKLGTTIGDIIIIINIIIFSSAAYFLGIETALYSMITYLSASKTLDFVIEGIEEYTGVTVISSHAEEIRQMITQKLGRGVTIYKGKRGFGVHGHREEVEIIYTVITRLEVNKLNVEIEKIDPNAFVIMTRIKDTRGGMIKKRPLK